MIENKRNEITSSMKLNSPSSMKSNTPSLIKDNPSFPVIYNSLNPHFSMILFFEQLFIHITFPILLPYFYWKYGVTFLYAHGYYPLKSFNILNWGFPISVYLTILTRQFLPKIMTSGYFVPTCILLLHRFMVSMKYATMSQSEYS